MPTVNAYKNNSGYYIRAWTSDLGNINYKLHKGGNKIIEQFGLIDGNDISWDTIRTLRAAGELYTDGSGTLGADDVVPPTGSAKSLSSRDAQSLLEAVLEISDPSQEQLAEICDILGVEVPESVTETLELTLKKRIESEWVEQLQTEHTLNGSAEEWNLSVHVQDLRDDEETAYLYCISIFLLGDVTLEEPGMARHDIFICEDHGIERWDFAVDCEKSWEKHAEMAQQMSYLLPHVVAWLLNLGVNVGTPDEAFGTEMKDTMR